VSAVWAPSVALAAQPELSHASVSPPARGWGARAAVFWTLKSAVHRFVNLLPTHAEMCESAHKVGTRRPVSTWARRVLRAGSSSSPPWRQSSGLSRRVSGPGPGLLAPGAQLPPAEPAQPGVKTEIARKSRIQHKMSGCLNGDSAKLKARVGSIILGHCHCSLLHVACNGGKVLRKSIWL